MFFPSFFASYSFHLQVLHDISSISHAWYKIHTVLNDMIIVTIIIIIIVMGLGRGD